jgi:hypothetical protein
MMMMRTSWRLALTVLAMFLCVPGAPAAEPFWLSQPEIAKLLRSLGVGYNRVAASKGPVTGMEWVYRRSLEELPNISPDDRPSFETTLEKWARQMQNANPALVTEYVKFNRRFGGGRVWQWRRTFAEQRIGAFNWAGHRALHVSCKGIWNRDAAYDKGVGYFADLRCQFLQADGWSNFRLHAASDENFLTNDWRAGTVGSSTSTPPRKNGGGGCRTESGTAFTLNGVVCGQAVNVWFAYTNGNRLPDGWTCGPRWCKGPPDYTGIGGSFTWSP